MSAARKLISVLIWGSGFFALVLVTHSFVWSLIFFGPKESKSAELVGQFLSIPYTVFYCPAFLIPPGSVLDSSSGLIFITIVLIVAWGFVLRFAAQKALARHLAKKDA